jgi:chemotaxis protein MotB
MADDKGKKQPIIIKKKKVAHAGSHGGAWKIAYADLVTAMMAFFLVMWIIGMDVETRQGIAEYFQNMSARQDNKPASAQVVHLKGTPPVLPRERPLVPRDNNLDAPSAKLLSAQIDTLMASSPQLERMRGAVDIKIGDKDMRISFHEGGDTSIFVGNSKEMRPEAKRLIEGVAAILSRNRSRVMIEGHADSGGKGLNKWEMSTERAVVVRGALANAGIDDDRIIQITGLADTAPRLPDDPLNLGNREVVVVVPYDDPKAGL